MLYVRGLVRAPRRPVGRDLAIWKKRENLNPFMYQETAGRANPRHALLEPWEHPGVAWGMTSEG